MKSQGLYLLVLISLSQVSNIFGCNYCSQQINKDSCGSNCIWSDKSCSFIACEDQQEGCVSDGDSTYCHLDKNKNCVEFTTCANVPRDTNGGCPIKCRQSDDNKSCIDIPAYESCAKVPEGKCGWGQLIADNKNIFCYMEDTTCTNVDISAECGTFKKQTACSLVAQFQRACEWKDDACKAFTCENRGEKSADCKSYLTEVNPPSLQLCYFVAHNSTCVYRQFNQLSESQCTQGTNGLYIWDGSDESCQKCGNSLSKMFTTLIVALIGLILF